MNKIYRLIWNEITHTWAAVAESARARGKRASGAVLLAVSGVALAAPPAPDQLPAGGQVVAGSASIGQAGAVMNINQSSQRAAIDWQTFNVGSVASVNFNQPSAASVTLNRVLDSNPSQIFGRITAPGRVFLTNPNGAYFAPGASVDVGALVATTHGISNADFMAGNDRFTRNGATGSILNEGNLSAGLGGYIALLAPEVRNQGVIVAQLGTVALAAGEAYTLQFSGGQLTGIQVEPATLQALVENRQAVEAPGGLIILSALAADSLQGGVVRNSGRLAANSLTEKGGRILLEGDAITLASGSRLDASGATGGGEVRVGGGWQGGGSMHQATMMTMEQGSTIDVSATKVGAGGTAVLWSDVANGNSITRFDGAIDAQGAGGGSGGRIETSGHTLGVSGTVNAGPGGEWLLDPINMTISDGGTFSVPTSGGISAPSTNNVTVLNSSINTALNNGSSVTLQTSGGSGGSGNITVAANIAKTSGAASSLTLQADGAIVVNAGVTISDTSASALSLNLQATGPIRFVNNAASTQSVDIHGALYLGGKAGGATQATGNATYGVGIYVGDYTALSADSMTLRGQGAAGSIGVRLGTATSLAASGAVAVIGIGGQGVAGSTGSTGSNTTTKGAIGGTGGVGTSGSAGGTGIDFGSSASVNGGTIALDGTGGDGGAGGAGGTGGQGGMSEYLGANDIGGKGGTGGKGATGGAGGVGIVLNAATELNAGNGITLDATGGNGGKGGRGGQGGTGGYADWWDTSGDGGTGGKGGAGGGAGGGLMLADGTSITATTGTLAFVSTSGTGAAGTGGSGGSHGDCNANLASCGSAGSAGSAGAAGASAIAFEASGAGYIGAASGGASSADISFANNSLVLGTLAIQSTGALSIRPTTNSTTIGVGSGVGSLSIAKSAFWNGSSGNFKDGFSSITIGSASQTGTIGAGDLVYTDPLTLTTSGHVDIINDITSQDQSLTVTGGSYAQNSVDIATGSGDISITADTVVLYPNTGANPLQTSGALTLRPKGATTSTSLAGASTFDLSTTEIGYLKNSGASSITLGRSDSTSAMTIGNAVDLAGKTVNLNAGSFTDGDTTNRIITADALTLSANSGAIGGSGNNAIDVAAGTISASTPNNGGAWITSTSGYTLGASNVGSGTLSLATTGTGGSLTQSGAVTAGTLTASLAGASSKLDLGTQANAIATIAGVTAGGGFSLNNGNTGATVSANIDTSADNGAVSINTGTGSYTQNASIDVISGSGNITVAADNMVINNNSGNNAFTTSGELTLKTATVDRGISLNGTQDIAGQLTLQLSEHSAFKTGTTGSVTIGSDASTGTMNFIASADTGFGSGSAMNTLNLKAGAFAGSPYVQMKSGGTLNLFANNSGGDIGSSSSNFRFSASRDPATISVHTTGNGSAWLTFVVGSPLTLAESNVGSGLLRVTALGLNQSGAITAGTLSLAGASDDTTLDHAGNQIGALNGQTKNLTLNNTRDLELGGMHVVGNLNLVNAGDVTNSGHLYLNGTTTINAAGHDVSLNYPTNYITGAFSTTARNLNLRNAGWTTLGATTLTGNLSLDGGRDITQSAPLNVAGSTTFKTTYRHITLTDTANDFVGAVSVIDGNFVQITDKNDLHLGSANQYTLTAIAGAGAGTPGAGDLYVDAGGHIGAGLFSETPIDAVILVTGDGTSRFVNNAGANAISSMTPNNRWLVYTNDPYTNNDVLGGLNSHNQIVFGTHYTGRSALISAGVPSTERAPAAITETGNRYVVKVQPTAIDGYDPNKVTITATNVSKTYGDAVTLTTADNTAVVYGSGIKSFAEFSEPKPDWLDVSGLMLTPSGGTAATANVGSYAISLTGNVKVNSVAQTLLTMGPGNTTTWSYNDGIHYVTLNADSSVVVGQRVLTMESSGGAIATRAYDGTTVATFSTLPTITFSNVANSDTVGFSGTLTGAFEDKNVGTSKTVTTSGNLVLNNSNYLLFGELPTYTGDITSRSLTVAAKGVDKVYDATAAASVTLAAASTVAAGTAGGGLIDGDQVSYSYVDAVFSAGKDAGTGKAIAVSDISIAGLDVGNYTLANTTASATANIDKIILSLTDLTGSKEYDRSTALTGASFIIDTSKVLTGEVVSGTTTGNATFDTWHAGVGKVLTTDLSTVVLTGTDAQNYGLGTGMFAGSGTITPKSVTLTNGSVTKTYDASTAYDAQTADLAALTAQLVSGDTASAATFTFNNANAGTGKTVTLNNVTVADDNSGGNYALTLPAADSISGTIDKAAVTVSTSDISKTYDGTTAAVGSAVITAGQLYGADALSASSVTYAFSDKNAGTGKRVIVGGTASVTGGDNYTILLADNTTSTIVQASLSAVTGISAADKTYDGNTVASLDTGSAGFTGMVSGDILSVASASGAFSDKNAATGKTVHISGITVGGTDAGNYTLADATATATADITKASLSAVTGNSASGKVYDGNTVANLDTSGAGFTGMVSGDTLSVASASGAFSDKNAASGKTVHISGITVGGTDAGNYTLADNTATTTADIAMASLTITANAASKTYDGLAYSGGNGATYSGFVNSETSTVLGGTLAYSGTSQGAINTGSYVIAPGGQTSGNYSISYVDGALTINVDPAIAAAAQAAADRRRRASRC